MQTLWKTHSCHIVFICLACNLAGCATERKQWHANKRHASIPISPATATANVTPKKPVQSYWETPKNQVAEDIPPAKVPQSPGTISSNPVQQETELPESKHVVDAKPSSAMPNILDHQLPLVEDTTPALPITQEQNNLDSHTLPVTSTPEETKVEWTKPNRTNSTDADTPPPPPMDLVPSTDSSTNNMRNVGWQKFLPAAKSSSGNSHAFGNPHSKKVEHKPAKPQPSSEVTHKNPVKPATEVVVSKPSIIQPNGYFPPAGTFPHQQSATEMPLYPRPTSGLVTLSQPEFTYSNELVAVKDQKPLEPVESTKPYYPPQKLGFRDFPEYSTTWK